MKIKNRIWLVAFFASSLSFILIVSSIFLSDFFQNNIFNFNEIILNKLPPKFEGFYNNITTNLSTFLTYFSSSKMDNPPEKFAPLVCSCSIILFDLCIKKESFISITTGTLYLPLKKHLDPVHNFKILYWIVRSFYWISIAMFNLGWYYMDYPVMILTLLSAILIYFCGVITNKLFENRNDRIFKKTKD